MQFTDKSSRVSDAVSRLAASNSQPWSLIKLADKLRLKKRWSDSSNPHNSTKPPRGRKNSKNKNKPHHKSSNQREVPHAP